MQTAKFCPQCGAGLLPDNPLCPRCAFQVALLGGAGGFDPTLDSGQKFAAPKPEQLAQHFPQLEILDLIGQGGMGAVYKARQKGLDRIVALKILPPEAARDPSFAERFRREGKALARLNHPNIVNVFDSNETGGLYYFIMEFVDGVNLRQAIQMGRLSPTEALAIVPQICDALQYAHDEGVVHRDIKPENVLIDAKGRVKIADFGLARLLSTSEESYTLTGTHQVMGTPRYMAPEQLEGTHAVDHRADIYSLGVVFYEMLTGELPIGRFAPPSKKVQVDVRLDEVVLRTLEKEPGLRYQQAQEVKTAVQTISSPRPLPAVTLGRDWKSPQTFFGIPLVHIASGIDPATGKPRIAKGIIAIGDQAYGGFALGGMAVGIVAIGGMAVGAITFGGLSFGMCLALGGCAVSTVAAFGGFALAPIAVGGCAVGYYVAGGAGFGYFSLSGNRRDPEAVQFFQWGLRTTLHALPVIGTLLIAIPLVIGALAYALLKIFQSIFYPPTPLNPIPKQSVAVEGAFVGCFALLMLGILTTLPVLLLGAAYFSIEKTEAIETLPEAATEAAEEPTREPQHSLDWRGEPGTVPRLSSWLVKILGMRGDTEEGVNRVLVEVYQKYLPIEREHSHRDETPGRQQTALAVPAEPIEALERELWDRLDPLLDPDQQRVLRQYLWVKPLGRNDLRAGRRISASLQPGILGWGSHKTTVTLHRAGEWFDWEIGSQGVTMSGSQRGIQPHLERFWAATPEAAPLTPETPATPEVPEPARPPEGSSGELNGDP